MQCLYRRSPLPIAIRLRPIPPDSTLFPYTTLFRSKFNEALMTGDLEALVDVLAPDVVYMADGGGVRTAARADRKSTRLNSSHVASSYAVFCLKKKRANI